MPVTAIVMNVFYTGLGIARSLGEQDIPVIGLTSQRGIYGNFTRYATTVPAPDSRTDGAALLEFLLALGKRLQRRAVIFPTRDDDVVFLDRYRDELEGYFSLVIPRSGALDACLNKWCTYKHATKAGVAAPRCWLVERREDLDTIKDDLVFPCVVKPLSAHHWRQGNNWELVGAQKAMPVYSLEQLEAQYAVVARADTRLLIQEMIAGGDDSLVIAACYLDSDSNWVAGFNTQKLVQVPEGFGTGCIVQTVERPELFEPTARLLKHMGFTGIAEVEYKWDAASRQYKLIEINPRPWDQHRLGKTCGVDLAYLAYCDHAGIPMPVINRLPAGHKWIAEDTFVRHALSLIWRRDPASAALFRLARGKRIYAVWSAKDPLPLLAYMMLRYVPQLIVSSISALWSAIVRRNGERLVYRSALEDGKSHG